MVTAEKTVWLLGSGFSKPLGGPLLRDLFRWQEREDELPWVQLCFRNGVDSGLWDNAEPFMAYVDDGYRGSVFPKRERLQMLIGRSDPLPKQQLEVWLTSGDPHLQRHEIYQRTTLDTFDRKVKRAVAAECSRFLIRAEPKDEERWLPYLRWVDSLRPGIDTVICFNYDQVVETALAATSEPNKLWTVVPNEYGPSQRVDVLKLHGSVDWRLRLDPQDNSRKVLEPRPVPREDLHAGDATTARRPREGLDSSGEVYSRGGVGTSTPCAGRAGGCLHERGPPRGGH